MAEPLILVEPSRGTAAPRGQGRFALLQLGFRPFYLLASAFAAPSIAALAAQIDGWGKPYLVRPLWHAPEMVFAFAQAVVVGFLFTAVRGRSGARPLFSSWSATGRCCCWPEPTASPAEPGG